MPNIHYIDEADIKDQRVLLRADFDVSMNPDASIANDTRISQNIPTMKYLLERNNRIICVAKLNRPHGPDRDPKHSLKLVVERLRTYLPGYTITLVNDFLTDSPEVFNNQTTKEILVLENIRFYPQEKQNDLAFTKRLAALADVYVNDAFAMAHRTESSVVGVPGILPAYGGLLLKKELKMISQVVQNPKKPVVIILGGSKISSKINLISKLLTIGDYLLIGGGIANTFLAAQNIEVGESIYEYDEKENARRLMYEASQHGTQILLPTDAICGNKDDLDSPGTVKKVGDVLRTDSILDIGPETQAAWRDVIEQANTIIWNGPVGYFENAAYRKGTDFIYSAITHNDHCMSVVGGGDTLTAISKKEYLEKITHVSTGGGAMLEFIEKGTLPGIEALQLKHDS